MSDLISRQAAIDAAVQSIKDWDGMFMQDANCRIRDAISELPSAQPKHGRWVEHHEPFTWMGYTTWTCSECGYECGYEKEIGFRTSYCPNCGAKMDEVSE